MPASACVPVKRDRFFAGSQAGVADVKLAYALERNLEAAILVGRDYALDGELAARMERITGEESVDLSAQEPPKLALVG